MRAVTFCNSPPTLIPTHPSTNVLAFQELIRLPQTWHGSCRCNETDLVGGKLIELYDGRSQLRQQKPVWNSRMTNDLSHLKERLGNRAVLIRGGRTGTWSTPPFHAVATCRVLHPAPAWNGPRYPQSHRLRPSRHCPALRRHAPFIQVPYRLAAGVAADVGWRFAGRVNTLTPVSGHVTAVCPRCLVFAGKVGQTFPSARAG